MTNKKIIDHYVTLSHLVQSRQNLEEKLQIINEKIREKLQEEKELWKDEVYISKK
jgi:hypothetical protein